MASGSVVGQAYSKGGNFMTRTHPSPRNEAGSYLSSPCWMGQRDGKADRSSRFIVRPRGSADPGFSRGLPLARERTELFLRGRNAPRPPRWWLGFHMVGGP